MGALWCFLRVCRGGRLGSNEELGVGRPGLRATRMGVRNGGARQTGRKERGQVGRALEIDWDLGPGSRGR